MPTKGKPSAAVKPKAKTKAKQKAKSAPKPKPAPKAKAKSKAPPPTSSTPKKAAEKAKPEAPKPKPVVQAAAGTDGWQAFTPAKIDKTKCLARTWASGLGGQCTRAAEAGGICKMHMVEDKWRTHGRVDGPIPEAKLLEFQRGKTGKPKEHDAEPKRVPRTPKASGSGASAAGDRPAKAAKSSASDVRPVKAKPLSSAPLDWASLTFDVTPTVGRAEMVYRDGSWSKCEFVAGSDVRLHMFANVLHYGQEVFEGLKAFHCKDGNVRVFNDKGNWERMRNGCKRMLMPELTYEQFRDAIDVAVRWNRAFIPPPDACAAGASLYIRPVMFGSGPQVSLHPSNEFTFMVMVVPVGPYFKSGFNPIKGQVITDYDRAAPRGVGSVKCAGNYAADTLPSQQHKKKGFPIGLYLDPKENKYIEEFNGANFVGVTESSTLVTPDSPTILPSITNACLIQLAQDRGYTVERRKIDLEEEIGTFVEVGAVGTAAVVCPLKSLTMGEKVWEFSSETIILQELFKSLTEIQRGEATDKHQWVRIVPVG
eukprot:TRINITY_DN8115_c0_g2_i1.p1 TRINITY_DN8115_c0_g2~~TRINITY_DN8115_c0_g2_i1.p1  ORF type:complete len:537 (+),score=111.33 TRINITY_DN8115_c0_g2_i1:93-1703(+)